MSGNDWPEFFLVRAQDTSSMVCGPKDHFIGGRAGGEQEKLHHAPHAYMTL
jgi:hypothetical protein